MKIFSALKFIKTLNERLVNGKYVMQDEILYRITGFGELKTILDKGGFTPNMKEESLPMSKRKDSSLYDARSERKQLGDIDIPGAQTKRKLKLPKNRIRGFFKSFARGLNDFLSLNFYEKNNKVIIAFYRQAIKDIPNSELQPFGWLKNFYDNYPDSSEETYIADKHELEDRLYYNGNFLPFRNRDLKKYIKCVYFNPKNITANYEDEYLALCKQLRKLGIEIRLDLGHVGNNLTHLNLQKTVSNLETDVMRADANPDNEKLQSKKDKAIKKIENSSPLEYYHYNRNKAKNPD